MIRRLSVILLPLVLGGWWLEAFEPRPAPSVSESHHTSALAHAWLPSDTVQAGRVFIAQFPDSLEGFAVTRYSAERLPLNSWLLNSSFMWQTSEEDRGDHRFVFDALMADSVWSDVWSLDVVVK